MLFLFISCKNKTDKSQYSDFGNVVFSIEQIKYDADLLIAQQPNEKDSLERKRLWSRVNEFSIDTDNYLKSKLSCLTEDINVRQSNDY